MGIDLGWIAWGGIGPDGGTIFGGGGPILGPGMRGIADGIDDGIADGIGDSMQEFCCIGPDLIMLPCIFDITKNFNKVYCNFIMCSVDELILPEYFLLMLNCCILNI